MSMYLRYLDVPEGAQEKLTVTGAGQPFSDPAVIAAGTQDIPYATLEPGVWQLDGSRVLLPDAPGNLWWSESISNESGAFPRPPVLELRLPEPCTATGLTFTFSPSTGQWCDRVQVQWYRGETLLDEVTARPDAAGYVLQRTVTAFDRVLLTILGTHAPGQLAKVQRITVGQTIVYDADALTEVTLRSEADPSLCVLTADTMTVQLYDAPGRTLHPQQNQRLELYRDGALVAVHYITGSSRHDRRRYSFTGQSAIALLEEEFPGDIYREMPAAQLLEQILPGHACVLDSAFSGSTLTGYLPPCTRREALRQVSFALGALVQTQGGGAIRLTPLPDTVSGSFGEGEIFTGASVQTTPRIARVEVAEHSYTPSEETETLLSGQAVTGENVLLTFSQPHHSYTLTGGTLTDSGAGWVRLTADGAVTLTAKKYLHTTRLHSISDPAATEAERGNVLTVDSATLVSSGNAEQVLQRLYASAQLRCSLTHRAVVTDQRTGQLVESVSPWGGSFRGYLTQMESTFTRNGHTADVTVLGSGEN